MDEQGFRAFSRRHGRSKSAIESCIRFVKQFEEYLRDQKDIQGIDEATPRDIREFVAWGKHERKSVNSYLWAIHRYYEFMSDKEMYAVTLDLRRHEIEDRREKRKPLQLMRVQGVAAQHVAQLEALGITNVKQMIAAGRTRTRRHELSKKTGIPLVHILDLVKRADLTRISDIKGVKGRLLVEAKVDTIKKLAACSAEELRRQLMAVNAQKKILKRPPTLVETTYWVEQANKLPDIVEY